MARTVWLLSLIVILSCLVSVISAQRLVKVHARGFVVGTTRRTRSGRLVSAYLGIPYAEPPVGDLRFRNPVPKKSWDGILRATTDSPQCPQLLMTDTPWSEDCLYLNVYTPRRHKNYKELLPVAFYVHGGGYLQGNASSTHLGPEYLLDKDVILVTVAYRLGMLGFLSTGDDAASGNFGLKDQTLALHWVQKHIMGFGGNPSRITIFGESAGASSVNLLALSEKSKDLFQNYVVQSGSALCPWAFNDRESYVPRAKMVAKSFNCPTDSTFEMVKCFRSLSVAELLRVDPVTVGLPFFLIFIWGPTNEHVHEDAFLTETPLKLIAGNKMKDGPMMTGLVRNEGLLVTTVLYANDTLFNAFKYNLPILLTSVFNIYLPKVDPLQLTVDVMKFYFNGAVSNDKQVLLQQITDLSTDIFFAYPQVVMMKYRRNTSKIPFYFYDFGYRGTYSTTSAMLGNNDNIGVSHSDDLIYLFKANPGTFGLPSLSMSATDYKVVDVMNELWTSFISDSVPESVRIDGGQSWPNYGNSDVYLQIGSDSDPSATLRSSFLQERMAFWQRHYPM